ncbi:hypothetical protein D3218_07520 [Aureimonas flava]|uniref:Uncharacterized protein n=1 Tax=Aureimonas flava TaxID=2320271 RepID=A0A3A1WNN9_9HYPH|nr:hypothetical protein [Aureimonas flava]RIY02135.1 hypothetical protein D3218_07520 [Aureimonas flava]
MEHVAALLLLVGCTPDSSVCTEIPVPQPIYRGLEECEAAKPLAMRLSGTYDRRVMASCTGLTQAELDGSASVEWAVNRAGDLAVKLDAAPQLVASR